MVIPHPVPLISTLPVGEKVPPDCTNRLPVNVVVPVGENVAPEFTVNMLATLNEALG